jgi:hypothetical protein
LGEEQGELTGEDMEGYRVNVRVGWKEPGSEGGRVNVVVEGRRAKVKI